MAKVARRPSTSKDKKRAALTGGALLLRKNLILFYSPKQNCVKLSQLQTMNNSNAKVNRPPPRLKRQQPRSEVARIGERRTALREAFRADEDSVVSV